MIFAQEIPDSIPETEQVMPPAGAPWWAFMVTAGVAILAVLISNSSNTRREQESWRREQLLTEILNILTNSRKIQDNIGKISFITVEGLSGREYAEKDRQRLLLMREANQLLQEFPAHYDLISVMASPSFTSSVIDYYDFATECTEKAVDLLGNGKNNEQELKDLKSKLDKRRSVIKLNATAELKISGFRARRDGRRMKKFVASTAHLKGNKLEIRATQ